MTKLDRTWKNCLRMWKWIARKYNDTVPVWDLKAEWLKKNRFTKDILCNCFFCQYAGTSPWGPNCKKCPGKLVNNRFSCEAYDSYHWRYKPKAFYRKLVELDKKRRSNA